MLSWRMKASETVIAHYLGVLKSIRYRFLLFCASLSIVFGDNFHKVGDKPVSKRFFLILCFVHSDFYIISKQV